MDKIQGTLRFSETEGKFYITNMEKEEILSSIEFNDTFQVLTDDKWIDTNLEIGSDANGELIFKLKNTNYSGNFEGLTVRK